MRKRIILFTVLTVIFGCALWAKEYKFPVTEIPDSLKLNAKEVMRNMEQVFEYKSPGKGTLTVTYALTILNENGLDDAILQCSYSQKLNKVYNIKGSIYNAIGEKIESLTFDKVYDVSAISGYSLYEDHRQKVFHPRTMTYPFTVEYSYSQDFDGLISIPDWEPVHDYNVSVVKSSNKLVCAKNLEIRYLERSIPEKVKITESEMATIYEWNINQVTAYTEQPYSLPFTSFCPNVSIVPQHIEIEGYTGTISTWDAIGKWINSLNKGLAELSPETVALLQDKVKACSSDYDKAKVIYEYMQNKTRYLNITIGIGGWQPLPASTIDRLGYGDCKALSNYTMALLNAVGVKAYYTLVGAGEDIEQTDLNFPEVKFNHAILCLPFSGDTVWLECTNQQVPFGFIGDFTDDRNVLLITEDGGKIAHTRSYSCEENQTSNNISVDLDEQGYAVVKEIAYNRGIQYHDHLPTFLAGTEERKKLILDRLNIPGVMLNNFQYEELRNEVPVLKETLNLDIPHYATLSGPRMLVGMVPMNKLREIPRKVTHRLTDVYIRRPRVSIDTIKFKIPSGFQAESVPSEIKTDCRFGSYFLKTTVQDNQIICIRRFEMKKGQHSPETYNELIDFFKKVAIADNSKASLKKI